MNNYLDLTKYSDSEVLSMLKQKQKEYMLLIQSEIIAKKVLEHYGEEFYTSSYHTRVINEHYLIYERALKKDLLKNIEAITTIGIPIYTVIARLEDSRDELKRNNDQRYFEYARLLDDITDNLKIIFYYKKILYREGNLYIVDGDKEELLDKELLDNLLEEAKKKTL